KRTVRALIIYGFFFSSRRRHTRFSRDWSSDVCSSDLKDWTAHMPQHDFPYLQKMYGYYGKTGFVENVHLPEDGHDFGYSKRKPVYDFISKHFHLDTKGLKNATGDYDESGCVIEEEKTLYAFGPNGELLPSNAIQGYENLEKLFKD